MRAPKEEHNARPTEVSDRLRLGSFSLQPKCSFFEKGSLFFYKKIISGTDSNLIRKK
jgi:hypothetical protein